MSLSDGQGCFTTLGLPLGFGILTSVARKKHDFFSWMLGSCGIQVLQDTRTLNTSVTQGQTKWLFSG